ncbi:MAG: ABC-type transport auxiliary lipoprotein family protein [Bacteroidota bacterium]
MKKILIIAAISAFLWGGCRSSKPVAPTFYTIEYPFERQVADTLEVLPFTLEIKDVDVHPVFSSNQIALREADNEIKYFVNHQWAARPHQSLERFILAYFNQNRVFQNVRSRFWDLQPDYQLYTSIYHLEIVRNKKDFYARLHLEFRLDDAQGKTILRHTADNSRLIESRDLNLFTTAVNNMFFEELNFFARKMRFEFDPGSS